VGEFTFSGGFAAGRNCFSQFSGAQRLFGFRLQKCEWRLLRENRSAAQHSLPVDEPMAGRICNAP
jgi:hypothetical protein